MRSPPPRAPRTQGCRKMRGPPLSKPPLHPAAPRRYEGGRPPAAAPRRARSPVQRVRRPLHQRVREVRAQREGGHGKVGPPQELAPVVGGEGLPAVQDGLERRHAGARLDRLERVPVLGLPGFRGLCSAAFGAPARASARSASWRLPGAGPRAGPGAWGAGRRLVGPAGAPQTFKPQTPPKPRIPPGPASSRRSPCQQPNRWCAISAADAASTTLLPVHAQCAAHHRPWPTIWGWRVMRMMPVSHRCSFGLSTAATWGRFWFCFV